MKTLVVALILTASMVLLRAQDADVGIVQAPAMGSPAWYQWQIEIDQASMNPLNQISLTYPTGPVDTYPPATTSLNVTIEPPSSIIPLPIALSSSPVQSDFDIQAVPEPSMLALSAFAVAGLLLGRGRK